MYIALRFAAEEWDKNGELDPLKRYMVTTFQKINNEGAVFQNANNKGMLY